MSSFFDLKIRYRVIFLLGLRKIEDSLGKLVAVIDEGERERGKKKHTLKNIRGFFR